MLALSTAGVDCWVVTGVTCGEVTSTTTAGGGAVVSGDSLAAGVTVAGVS